MNKVTVEVYLPAALRTFDVRISIDSRLSKVTELTAKALEGLSGGVYAADSGAILCWRETGEILNVNMTMWELGLKNGSRLMLV